MAWWNERERESNYNIQRVSNYQAVDWQWGWNYRDKERPLSILALYYNIAVVGTIKYLIVIVNWQVWFIVY